MRQAVRNVGRISSRDASTQRQRFAGTSATGYVSKNDLSGAARAA
jgi:hypothetical protein